MSTAIAAGACLLAYVAPADTSHASLPLANAPLWCIDGCPPAHRRLLNTRGRLLNRYRRLLNSRRRVFNSLCCIPDGLGCLLNTRQYLLNSLAKLFNTHRRTFLVRPSIPNILRRLFNTRARLLNSRQSPIDMEVRAL